MLSPAQFAGAFSSIRCHKVTSFQAMLCHLEMEPETVKLVTVITKSGIPIPHSVNDSSMDMHADSPDRESSY
ncbi:hypothetical protein Acr_01g0000150 [Actinidia rufa]|uniref:Uncharacterized protein n=1 Tax=Actinidia rufa TaxID=165716 RepID=A0A7J0E236_9ERIC|nr:hypothetical protein Acr_01g0000150 [Actinidia rufa]